MAVLVQVEVERLMKPLEGSLQEVLQELLAIELNDHQPCIKIHDDAQTADAELSYYLYRNNPPGVWLDCAPGLNADDIISAIRKRFDIITE